MARKKTAASEAPPAPEPAKPAPAQPKASSPAAKPQAKAKAKAKAKAEPKPEPKPVEPEPVVEEETEAKKKRRRAGANKKKEEQPVSGREQIKKEAKERFAKELKALQSQLPFLDASAVPADKLLERVKELKEKMRGLLEKVDAKVVELKVVRPKKQPLMSANFDEVLAPSMAAAMEQQHKDECAFEAYRQFVTDTQALKDEAAKRSKEFDKAETLAREKERLLGSSRRIASLMGVPVEQIANKVTSTIVDLSSEQMAVYFMAPANLNRKFEKAHGVLVEQIGGGKGKGKGKGGPVQCKVSGMPANVEACKKDMLGRTELSRRSVNIEGRRVGGVIGEGGTGLKKIEQDHNVLCSASKTEIVIVGAAAKIAAAEKDLAAALDDASSTLSLDVDPDVGRVLVGPGGANIQKLQTNTKTQMKLERKGEGSQLVIKGTKEQATKAKAEVEKFIKNTHTELVKLEADVLAKLFRGKGKGKGKEEGAKGKGKGKGKGSANEREILQVWQDLRDSSGVTIAKKEGGVMLLGTDKGQVTEAKKTLSFIASRVLLTSEDYPVARESMRALTDAKCAEISKDTGCKLTIRRGGKGQDPCVELYGDDASKDKAKAAIEAQLDAEGRKTEISVTDAAVGFLLQKSGDAMRSLEAKFNVGVSLDRKNKTVALVGAKEAVDKAQASIEADIEKYEKVQASLETKEITVEAEQVGLIVGKAGSTIKWISQTSGASVNTSRDKKTLITLKGTAAQNAKAEKLIKETLAAKEEKQETNGDAKESGRTRAEDPPKAAGKGKKEAKKPQQAPNLESGNMFPSLGASLDANKGKKRRGGGPPTPEPKEEEAPKAATPQQKPATPQQKPATSPAAKPAKSPAAKPAGGDGWPIPPVDESQWHEGKAKKVKKEGGKKGAEIAGAADMGGIEFFTTTCETPDGDPKLLELVLQEMNVPVDPTAEETKGGSGHVGKMLLSASDKQLALVAYVPEEKAGSLSAITWMEQMIAAFGGYGDLVEGSTKYKAIAVAKQDGDKGKFPLKMRDEAIGASIAFLKSKGLFPDKDDDDEDDYCFGDDDFPCG